MKKRNLRKVGNILHIILLILLAIIIVGSFYLKIYFSNESLEELIFYLTNGAGNADLGVFFIALKKCFPFLILIVLLLISLFYNVMINKTFFLNIKIFKFRERKFQIYPINFICKHKIIFSIILMLVSAFIVSNNLSVFEYAKNNLIDSEFIKKNYIQGSKKNIDFKKKKNLIYIYVESLETTFFTKKQGGDWDYEVIPELYELLQDNDSIYFASDDESAGMYNLEGTTWTTASIVANSTGLPFKIPIDGNEYHSNNFMNGSYALGDVLKDNGYHNELISAAVTSFGGIKEYFTRHGDFKIVDFYSLKNFNFSMEDSDYGAWGFNDNYMFEISKERLKELSKNDQPFNLTIIGVDTHHVDGFVGDYTIRDKYNTQYENVYATESMLIGNFVDWIKKQKFYKDTTIVIVGDHPSMQTDFFANNDQTKRLRYNVIINSAVSTKNTKNRVFTAVDMYPTTLAAIGAKIEGNQLGLGVNLFSDKETLVEKYGLDKVNEQIKMKSLFYNKYILGDDYLEMVGENENEK